MKKLFILFTLVFLAVGITACSSDDDTVDVVTAKDLFLKVDRNRINENETVSFTAVDSDTKSLEADFYIDGVKVGKSHKFEKRGVYVVTAKKSGYKVSSPLAIQVVKEGEIIIKTLEIKADKYEVITGETVKFTVSDGNHVLKDATIFFEGESNAIHNEWAFKVPGVYKLYGSLNGYFDSNVITITVKQKTVTPKKNFVINGTNFNIDFVTLSVATDSNLVPLLLHEEVGGEFVHYFIYNITYAETNYDFISYSMKVFVPEGTKKLVLPYEVDKSKVVPLEVMTAIHAQLVDQIRAEDLDTNTLEWLLPFEENVSPGKLRANFKTKDGKNSVDFDGEYKGLYGNILFDANLASRVGVSKTNIKVSSKIAKK